MRANRIIQLFLAVFVIWMFAACEYEFIEPIKPPPIDPTDTISFSAEIVPIFEAQACTECHAGTFSPNLLPENAYQSIMDDNLVDLDNPEQSIIYTKADPAGTHPKQYTLEQQAKILGWIQQGAENN